MLLIIGWFWGKNVFATESPGDQQVINCSWIKTVVFLNEFCCHKSVSPLRLSDDVKDVPIWKLQFSEPPFKDDVIGKNSVPPLVNCTFNLSPLTKVLTFPVWETKVGSVTLYSSAEICVKVSIV